MNPNCPKSLEQGMHLSLFYCSIHNLLQSTLFPFAARNYCSLVSIQVWTYVGYLCAVRCLFNRPFVTCVLDLPMTYRLVDFSLKDCHGFFSTSVCSALSVMCPKCWLYFSSSMITSLPCTKIWSASCTTHVKDWSASWVKLAPLSLCQP